MTRIVKLEHPKLKGWIEQKDELIQQGRKMSGEVDLISEAMESINKKLVAEEQKVDVKDLVVKGEELVKQLEGLQKQIYQRVRENTPQELRDQYELLEKQKAEKMTELNKLGHKVQKVKDKIVPLVQKLGKPHLETMYEDLNTTKLDEDGNVVLEIFDHLEEFKSNYAKKQ